MQLEPSEYRFKIKGADVGRGKIRVGCYMCINPGGITEELPGERTKDPAFGLPAVWINADRRQEAERLGYMVVDPPSIIATHLTEIIRHYSAEILSLQTTKSILEELRPDNGALVEEAEKALPLVGLQKVLQGLLREQVPIRNVSSILEAVIEFAPVSKAHQFLTEKARQSLGRQICLQFTDDDRMLRVLTLERGLEEKIIESRQDTPSGSVSALEPSLQTAWIRALAASCATMKANGWKPIVLCSEAARTLVRNSTEREQPDLVVLSVPEVSPDINVQIVGKVTLDVGAGE
jgi:flagellar biosynthesis protein FlhA